MPSTMPQSFDHAQYTKQQPALLCCLMLQEKDPSKEKKEKKEKSDSKDSKEKKEKKVSSSNSSTGYHSSRPAESQQQKVSPGSGMRHICLCCLTRTCAEPNPVQLDPVTRLSSTAVGAAASPGIMRAASPQQVWANTAVQLTKGWQLVLLCTRGQQHSMPHSPSQPPAVVCGTSVHNLCVWEGAERKSSVLSGNAVHTRPAEGVGGGSRGLLLMRGGPSHSHSSSMATR